MNRVLQVAVLGLAMTGGDWRLLHADETRSDRPRPRSIYATLISFRISQNPKGIPQQSPGLRRAAPERSEGGGTRYPGETGFRNHNPEGVATQLDSLSGTGRNPVGVVDNVMERPRVAYRFAGQPWAEGRNPVGIGVASTKQPSAPGAIVQAIPPEMRLGALPLIAPEPKNNPTTAAKVALGRLLFFDPILSSTKDVSCATCHHPRFGWSDGRATPIGVGGDGVGPARTFRGPASLPLLARNVPTILNVGFNGLVANAPSDPAAAPMFWDSRVRSLEQQVFTPLASPGEMRGSAGRENEAVALAVLRVRAIGEYRERFQTAFDRPASEAVTAEHLAQAIAAFERSLVTPRSAFDRFQQGDASALDARQQRGLRLFQDAGCVQCHGGPMFSDFKLHFIGVPDSAPAGRREFRTPTLRNLRDTAPYMHNGSLRTLRDVLVFYDELAEAVSETLDGGDTAAQPPLDPLLKQLNLNPEDFPALEAFLETLGQDAYDQTAPTKVPSGLPVIP